MRTRDMEDSQGYYSHEEEITSMHVIMGNVETNSNGIRDRKEPVTMRSLQREVHSYRVDNEISIGDTKNHEYVIEPSQQIFRYKEIS
jgi:hypothetical protein